MSKHYRVSEKTMTDFIFQIRKNFDDFWECREIVFDILTKRTHHFPKLRHFWTPLFFISVSLFFDYTLVCHFPFQKRWISKKCSLLFSKTLIWLSYQAISLSSQKTNLLPEFSFRFFAVRIAKFLFSKVTFGGKFSMKKQRNFQERDSQDFLIHLFVHTSVIAKSSSLDNFISFSCW